MLMMLPAISDTLSMVPVTSRRAYSFLSAGTRLPVCPITDTPHLPTISAKRSIDWSIDRPGIDSSLSRVPPVCPSPRPDILATCPPAAATRGPTIRVVVSATPPVECLSTFTPGIGDRSILSPDSTIVSVSSVVSCLSMPRNQMAISMAAAW